MMEIGSLNLPVDIYPLTIVWDRYGGTYSGGEFIAWNLYPSDVPEEQFFGDIECWKFWLEEAKEFSGKYGKGATPEEAIRDLIRRAMSG